MKNNRNDNYILYQEYHNLKLSEEERINYRNKLLLNLMNIVNKTTKFFFNNYNFFGLKEEEIQSDVILMLIKIMDYSFEEKQFESNVSRCLYNQVYHYYNKHNSYNLQRQEYELLAPYLKKYNQIYGNNFTSDPLIINKLIIDLENDNFFNIVPIEKVYFYLTSVLSGFESLCDVDEIGEYDVIDLDKIEIQRLLSKKHSYLTNYEKLTIIYYYGFHDNMRYSLEEIGEMLGITKSCTQFYLNNAKKKIAYYLTRDEKKKKDLSRKEMILERKLQKITKKVQN